ncbi:MAG: L-rhamnose isomerase [Spirochaetales bacterium]|nr:L-rhamnose isomerase [Spirochaetales bacterium]
MNPDPKQVKQRLKRQRIETPSWGYADSGTRFGTFGQPSAAQSLEEKLEDAAQVHKYTGVCPTVALHIPWDKTDDWTRIKEIAANLGLGLGAVNPNLFQEEDYKLGSLCNPDPAVRRRAVAHVRECIDIARTIGSRDISLWLADGTSYPGQDSFRERKHRLEETLAEICGAMDHGMRLLIEYKFFEPAFYHTDVGDWGTAYMLALKLGEKAQVLVDLGHHPLGTNIEQIVAVLLDEGKLGGFHFNNKKFADDDLTVGCINPYELFLIYNELVAAGGGADAVAYMIDQSHNLKNKIEETIQSVMNLQEAYAKALLVDREALGSARRQGRIVDAEECLKDAFATDVRPLLREVREEMGLDPDPLGAYRAAGYTDRKAAERGPRHGKAKAGGYQS